MPLDLLLGRLWELRWRVILIAGLLLAAGSAIVLAWPRSFLAEAIIAPSETTGIATSSLLSPSPAFSGLLDPRPTGNFAIYLGALRSTEAATLLAETTPLLADLTERRGSGLAGWLRRALDLRVEADLDDARGWLSRNLAVTQTLGAVTWTLGLAYGDRDQALDLLRRLHGYAEAKVRADLADMARRRIQALEQRLARESDLYVRQSLYEMLATQQRIDLVVGADEAVAARIVSAPMVELRASLPNRPLLLLLLLVTAPMAAVALVCAGLLLRTLPDLMPRPAYGLVKPAE